MCEEKLIAISVNEIFSVLVKSGYKIPVCLDCVTFSEVSEHQSINSSFDIIINGIVFNFFSKSFCSCFNFVSNKLVKLSFISRICKR